MQVDANINLLLFHNRNSIQIQEHMASKFWAASSSDDEDDKKQHSDDEESESGSSGSDSGSDSDSSSDDSSSGDEGKGPSKCVNSWGGSTRILCV